MARVTGIGGLFFRSKDNKALGAWYEKYFGIRVKMYGGRMQALRCSLRSRRLLTISAGPTSSLW